jgi:hypothetical protein
MIYVFQNVSMRDICFQVSGELGTTKQGTREFRKFWGAERKKRDL